MPIGKIPRLSLPYVMLPSRGTAKVPRLLKSIEDRMIRRCVARHIVGQGLAELKIEKVSPEKIPEVIQKFSGLGVNELTCTRAWSLRREIRRKIVLFMMIKRDEPILIDLSGESYRVGEMQWHKEEDIQGILSDIALFRRASRRSSDLFAAAASLACISNLLYGELMDNKGYAISWLLFLGAFSLSIAGGKYRVLAECIRKFRNECAEKILPVIREIVADPARFEHFASALNEANSLFQVRMVSEKEVESQIQAIRDMKGMIIRLRFDLTEIERELNRIIEFLSLDEFPWLIWGVKRMVGFFYDVPSFFTGGLFIKEIHRMQVAKSKQKLIERLKSCDFVENVTLNRLPDRINEIAAREGETKEVLGLRRLEIELRHELTIYRGALEGIIGAIDRLEPFLL